MLRHMVLKLKLRRVGNSTGVILPKEALSRLHIREDDEVVLTEAPDNSYRLTVGEPDFERTMKIMHDLSRRYRNTLRELAK